MSYWLIIANSFTTVFQNSKNKLCKLNLNHCSHFFLSTFGEDFNCKKKNILSLCIKFTSNIVLRESNQVMTEFFNVKFLVSPFSFKGETAILSSFVFQSNFSVRLCEIKQSQCVVLFNLFKIVTSFVIKVKSSTIAFIRSVVVSVDSRIFSTCLIDFICSTKTADSTLKILSVNVAQSYHVETDKKILIKFGNIFEL